jgi:hypothetical protein
MDGVLQDLRYAWRALGRSRGFAATAVLTLALGIGATTAIFTVVNAVLLRPLPVEDPARLVSVLIRQESGELGASYSLPDFADYRAAVPDDVLDGLAAHHLADIVLNTGGGAEPALATDVSGNYFDVLGVRPAVGRFFQGEDETRVRDAAPVAVLSHTLWQQGYGGRGDVVGDDVIVNGVPLTIIGVAPDGFHGTMIGARPAVWLSR